ncbi:MAG: TolC family protein, partial [Sphingobacteriales bacterium]
MEITNSQNRVVNTSPAWFDGIKKYALLLLAGMLSFTAADAQDSARIITLRDALSQSLEANQNARKARLDVENSQYRIEEVRSRALPQINGSGTLAYNPILQLSAIPGELSGKPGTTLLIPFGQKWNANAGASLSQTLFDQSVFTGLKAAKTTKEFYQLNVQLTEEQILEQVATNYYRILVQRKQIGVLDSTIENTMRVRNILQGQFENGLARKIDVDRMDVN